PIWARTATARHPREGFPPPALPSAEDRAKEQKTASSRSPYSAGWSPMIAKAAWPPSAQADGRLAPANADGGLQFRLLTRTRAARHEEQTESRRGPRRQRSSLKRVRR